MPIKRSLSKRAVEIIGRDDANRSYFFDNLPSPEWIAVLRKYRFFKEPPQSIREGDSVSFPPWPESRYLAKVAGIAPDSVLDVMQKLKPTDNAHVHWDLVEAALAMPASHAAKWAEQEAEWICKQEYLYMLLPDNLAKLVAHLATGGEPQAALAVARPLLTVSPRFAGVDEDSDYWLDLRPRPRPKFEGYEYKHVLETCIPPLMSAAGAQALVLLCNLVDSALEETYQLQEGRQDEVDDCGVENSKPSTHGSIEQSKLRADYLDYKIELIGDDNSFISDAEDWLVAWIRNAAVELIENRQLSIEETVGILENYQWRVFYRILLYVLRKSCESAHGLIADRLTDRSTISYGYTPREYDLLLRDYFPTASPKTKQRVLRFIEQRVTIENIRDQLRNSDRTAFELRRRVSRWKVDRLSVIKPHLPPDWQDTYKDLLSTEGLERYHPWDPEHVSRPVVTTPRSPLSPEELSQKSVGEIATFLRTWDSPSWEFCPNTLGKYLAKEVQDNPQRFAESARTFIDLDATYVHAALGGLREAVKSERAFCWEPVLELCRWVVAQPYEIPGRDPNRFDDHKDPHWGWSYKAVADLLEIGLAKGEAMIPYSFRACVWQMIEALTKDPEPTPEYEAQNQSSPTEDSISTTRGAAMHAVIAYGHWVRGNLEEKSGEEWRGFEQVSEVQAMLEYHLDVSLDPALAVRAVYGQHFPDLDYLDRDWTSAHLQCIFPHDETKKDYWNAAWDPFIRFARPVASVFRQLEGEYRQAIARLGSGTDEVEDDSWALQRLAEEVMYFYWHGELALDDPNGLLPFFYKNAPSSLRAKAHESVGRWLKNHEGSLDGQVIQRLKLLWLSRLRLADEAESQALYKEELAAFGWWFASGRFDDSWALDRLTESIELARDTDDKSSVVERLASLAPMTPDQVARALYLIVESADYLRVFSFADDATKVLDTLLASGNQEAIEEARRTIDRLLSLGHRDFRDLMKSAEG